MEIENYLTLFSLQTEEIIKFDSPNIEDNLIFELITYILNGFRKTQLINYWLKHADGEDIKLFSLNSLKNQSFFISKGDDLDDIKKVTKRDFKNIYILNDKEKNLLIQKFKFGKKTEDVSIDFKIICFQNKTFKETYSNYLKPQKSEKEKPIQKPNKKIAGSDGKSQYTFLQIAENKPNLNSSDFKEYSISEIEKHNDENSTWIIVNNRIYDISIYKQYHPGGLEKIMMGAGKDATSLVVKFHPWINVHNILEKFQIGFVKMN